MTWADTLTREEVPPMTLEEWLDLKQATFFALVIEKT
jgi:hypothetical protein